MTRIKRRLLAHFISTSGDRYERLGKDLEEFTPELSATVESKRNILGEKTVRLTGYEKTVTVDTFYADEASPLFAKLQAIIDGDLIGSEVEVDVVEVKLWLIDMEGVFPAVRERAVLEVTSYGGDSNGYNIGFKLHYTGQKQEGRFNPESRTFLDD